MFGSESRQIQNEEVWSECHMINYLLNSLAYLTRVARIYIAVLTVGNAVEKRLLPRCSAPHRSINEYGQ